MDDLKVDTVIQPGSHWPSDPILLVKPLPRNTVGALHSINSEWPVLNDTKPMNVVNQPLTGKLMPVL